MVCLADKNQSEAPTCSENLELMENSLGEKRIALPVSATENIVKNHLFDMTP